MSIKAEISLDSTKAEAQAARAGAAIGGKLAKSTGGFFGGAESGLTKLNSGLSALTTGFKLLDSAITNADAITDLKDGVAAVLSPLADVNNEMEKLVSLSESPGLEFESVAKAHATFLALGKSSAESMDIIKELGNALQLGGGDPRQLSEIVSVMTRMTDRGEANIKTIHAMAEQMPVFRKAFTAAFGPVSVKEIEDLHLTGEQFISRFTGGLRELATAQKDAADKMGDLKDAGKQGASSVVGWVTEAVTNLTDLSRLAAAKITEAFGGNAQGLYSDILGAPAKGGRTPNQPSPESIEADRQQAAGRNKVSAMEKLAIIEKEARLQTDLNDSKFKENDLQKQIADAGLSVEGSLVDAYEAQKKQSDELQTKIDVMHKMKDLVEKTGAEEEDIEKFLKDQVAASRDLKDLQEGRAAAAKKGEDSAKAQAQIEKDQLEAVEKLTKSQEKERDTISKQQDEQRRVDKEKLEKQDEISKRSRDADIMEQESKGHKGKAAKMRHDAALQDKQKEFEALRMSPTQAKAAAAREVKIAEDKDYRERTGRSRIHGSRTEPDQAFGTAGLAHSAFRKGETTKLTPAEVAGSQSGGGGSATKAMDSLTAALKNLEAAAKKYNATTLN